jgi:hypothetical protein
MNSTDPDIFSFYNDNLGEFITPKNELLTASKLHNGVSIVVKHLKTIPNYVNLKKNNEFILRVITLIENLGITKNDKVGKTELFKEVYKQLFGTVPEEEFRQIFMVIDFLLSKHLVKKIKYYKKVWRFLKTNIVPSLFF